MATDDAEAQAFPTTKATAKDTTKATSIRPRQPENLKDVC